MPELESEEDWEEETFFFFLVFEDDAFFTLLGSFLPSFSFSTLLVFPMARKQKGGG